MQYDVIIIGGSYSGLSAGLQLARARRKVLVIDAGRRRNRFAETSHGFLTQDGASPTDIAAEGRAQLMEYETVDWLPARVDRVQRGDQAFTVVDDKGKTYKSRVLILATGVVDVLPEVPGLAERWGRQVFHCPYCHGYELQQGRIGVLASSVLSMHHALMLPDWGPTTLLLNGSFEPDADQLAQLQARDVRVERGLVERLTGDTIEVVMKDGRMLAFDGVFVVTQLQASPLAQQLGCELEEGPQGSFIRTDAMKATTVPGVFACGDTARAAGNVALAVGDGALAGVAAHRAMMLGF
ncbi:NAD(P)/FAD-dependent oxidoreductase [Pseudomonas sediminis]|uniref:Thioredoxin reductase n=1 Tax=Pseudomonas sediminis TaxID=1691904 RepID=A0A2G5FHY1_9PSED|nr:NAD(P)/FAD-dependent oxidoreductase [Pseudomonas sediminis]PIA67596.1 thioredoxin reductase [Pseudomonas sediminis]